YVQGIITRHQISRAPSGSRGYWKQFPELFKFTFRPRQSNPVSSKHQRPFSLVQLLDKSLDIVRDALVGSGLVYLRWIETPESRRLINRRSLDVERDIDPDWARSTVESKIKCFFEMETDFERIDHGHGILCNR